MPIGWRAQKAIPDALARAAFTAMDDVGVRLITPDNFTIVLHKMADQGILFREYEDGTRKDLYQIANDDYEEYVQIAVELQDKLMGFTWYRT